MTMQPPGPPVPPPMQLAATSALTPAASPSLVDVSPSTAQAANAAGADPDAAKRQQALADGVKGATAAAAQSMTKASGAVVEPDPFHMVFGHAPQPLSPLASPPAGGLTPITVGAAASNAPAPVAAPPIAMPPPIQPPPAPPPMVSDARAKRDVRSAGRDVWSFLDALERTNGRAVR